MEFFSFLDFKSSVFENRNVYCVDSNNMKPPNILNLKEKKIIESLTGNQNVAHDSNIERCVSSWLLPAAVAGNGISHS